MVITCRNFLTVFSYCIGLGHYLAVTYVRNKTIETDESHLSKPVTANRSVRQQGSDLKRLQISKTVLACVYPKTSAWHNSYLFLLQIETKTYQHFLTVIYLEERNCNSKSPRYCGTIERRSSQSVVSSGSRKSWNKNV